MVRVPAPISHFVVSHRNGDLGKHMLRDGQPFAWTEVKPVRIDGEAVTRYRLVIEDRHVGLRTPSCGPVQILDVGAELVIDEYGGLGSFDRAGTRGWVLKDAIVRPKKAVPLSRAAR